MASNTTANLTTQQISALRKHDRQVLNLQRIKEANQKRYEEGCAELEVADPVPPERKPAFRIADDQRAFLTRDSFVKVEADTPCGRNRPHGYGYITDIPFWEACSSKKRCAWWRW